jgi:predicted metal-dependent phosphoesterase TrpH
VKFADLHLHTFFSDGTYSPEELVSESAKAGLSAIAVVDHDTVEGIRPVLKEAGKKAIEIIPGIELTAEDDGSEIHILGYFVEYERKDFLEKLDILKKNRVDRIHKIINKLNELGMDLKAQDVFDIARCGTAGRLHVARAMVKAGVVGSTAEAFQKYIGDKGPGYVCGFRFNPQEAIKLIRDVGGISVLAHPYILSNDELVPKYVDYGIMGLEVYYPEHTQSMVNFYLRLAQKYNLLVTGGSDCHGRAKPDVRIGSIKIPYELVEKLKEAKAKL